MDIIQAIYLAIIEGLTEFLPISSTAHMKFYDFLTQANKSAFRDMFEVIIQLPAILAVVVLYWKKFFNFKNTNFYIKLLIAIIPALLFGGLFKKYIEEALGNITFIACVMIAGGIILIFIDNYFTKNTINHEKDITFFHALKIGSFQVLSIIFPGLSRSASTIIGGMQQGLTRKEAAEFSFFLAVPTMMAASAKSFYDACKQNYLDAHSITEIQAKSQEIHISDILSIQNLQTLFTGDNMLIFIVGCVVSFVVALLAVKFFIEVLQKFGFKFFGYYRIITGIIILAVLFIRK